jgi:hypothetical protein
VKKNFRKIHKIRIIAAALIRAKTVDLPNFSPSITNPFPPQPPADVLIEERKLYCLCRKKPKPVAKVIKISLKESS